MGLLDFFKKDFQQSHGGFGNFVEGMLGGIQDKFAGITPQQRFQMELQRRQQEEDERNKAAEMQQERERQAALERYRNAMLEDSDQNRALREVEMFKQEFASEQERKQRLQQHLETMEYNRIQDALKSEAEIADREDEQAHDIELERLRQKGRFDLAAEKADTAETFKPSVKFNDFMTKTVGIQEVPVPLEEAQANYEKALRAEREVWEATRGEQVDEIEQQTGPNPILDRIRAQIKKDQNVADATQEREDPQNDQNEYDEAETKRLNAIADFERYQQTLGRFNETGAGLSTHGSGGLEGRTTSRESSSSPALVEQDYTEANKSELQRREISQFRQLIEAVAQGDGDAAKQLEEMTGPGRREGFAQFEQEYGPEALDQLRQIYRQSLKSDPPF